MQTARLSFDAAIVCALDALMGCGANRDHAAAIAHSVVTAEAEGNHAVGFSHLFDYCDALHAGRMDGTAEPDLDLGAPDAGCSVVRVNANHASPHLGFARAWPHAEQRAKQHGLAAISVRGGYTCGALGYFARIGADAGLCMICATNAGPAVMAASGGAEPVFSTNPMAFAVPGRATLPVPGGTTGHANVPAMVIDQSSAACAIVSVRQHADAGEPLPSGWALDSDGNPTTDATAALSGTLVPFGGPRGANIAMMVELLAAGLTGGNWSVTAPSFVAGDACPGTGLFVLAINPGHTGGPDAAARMAEHLAHLADGGGYLPGIEGGARLIDARLNGLTIADDALAKARALASARA